MDNMKKVRVRVTQKDIDEPCTNARSTNCPFARAINRRLKDKFNASVGVQNLNIHGPKWGDDAIGLKLPLVVSSWIIEYDQGQYVKPIRVTMSLPKNALKSVKE